MSDDHLERLPLKTLVQLCSYISTADFFKSFSRRAKQDDAAASNKSLCQAFLNSEVYDSDGFQAEVARKTQTDMLRQSEAEREVIVDYLIHQKGSKENALFSVLETSTTEPNILMIVNTLLARGANPSCRERNGKKRTPLHCATSKGFADVVKELLFKEARADVRDGDNKMPVHLAVSNKQDDIAALLILSMDNETVRGLFTVRDDTGNEEKAELSLHDQIRNENMKQTVLAVLSCMMDPLGESSSVRVHYHALDADENGRSPRHEHFDRKSRSCLHLISTRQHADYVYHDVVRLLLKLKWSGYARRSFIFNAVMFAFLEALLCSGAVLASLSDTNRHTETIDIARAVIECLFLPALLLTLVLELNQIRKHRREYVKDKFNVVSLASCVCLLLVVPLRYTEMPQQWPIYSFGFLLWTLRIFNFAAVFREMGAYSQVLWRIMLRDFPQFLGVFAIILIAFSGSFVLALRGEDDLDVHDETRNFWETMFTGIRILIEGQPFLDYYGPDGYSAWPCILMVAFLGMTCVVLLSILIAQLSNTYQNVQSDAHRQLELNRAWIITRVELHSVYFRFRREHRIKMYKPFENINNPKEVLKKWDSPQLSEINRHVKDIKDLHETHSLKLRHMNKRVKHIEEQISEILMLLKSPQPNSSTTIRHDLSTGRTPKTPVLESVSQSKTDDAEHSESVSESDVTITVASDSAV